MNQSTSEPDIDTPHWSTTPDKDRRPLFDVLRIAPDPMNGMERPVTVIAIGVTQNAAEEIITSLCNTPNPTHDVIWVSAPTLKYRTGYTWDMWRTL